MLPKPISSARLPNIFQPGLYPSGKKWEFLEKLKSTQKEIYHLGGSPIKMFIPCSYPTANQFLVPHSWTEEVKEHSTLGEMEWQRLKWTAKRGLWGKRNNVKSQRKGSKRNNIFRKIKEVTVHMKQKPEFLQIQTILKNKNFLKIQLNGQKVKLKKFH